MAPFPWFGSKRQVADLIWERLGDVANYVEPFAGSLAVLLANPLRPKIETVNDADAMIVNFWRAVAIAPDEVARHVDAPSSDLDLRARQTRLLLVLNESWKACVATDPDFFDAKVAGWWLYGVCSSVGSNWLATKGANASIALSSAGVGVHRPEANAQEMMARLAARLRKVRVCCRDWSELVTPSVTFKNRGLGKSDVTGVLLDPPYEGGDEPVYREHAVAFDDVRRWAIELATSRCSESLSARLWRQVSRLSVGDRTSGPRTAATRARRAISGVASRSGSRPAVSTADRSCPSAPCPPTRAFGGRGPRRLAGSSILSHCPLVPSCATSAVGQRLSRRRLATDAGRRSGRRQESW